MFRNIFKKIYLFVVKISNIGVTQHLSYQEKKKTQLLNIIVSCGIVTNFIFFIINLAHQKTILGVINLLLLIGGIIILIINSYRKFLAGTILLTFLASLLFTAGAVLFRNGGEYFLIVNLIIILIYFNEKKYLLAISIVNCSLFIGIKIFLQTGWVYDTVTFGRVIFNITWTLTSLILALLFFKNEQITYREQIEEKNKELQKSNDTKQKLFSIISHDLRSPIGQLKSSLDMVNRDYITPETFQQISLKLSTEVNRLHITLDNLLRWSISQLQGITASPEKVDLANLLEHKLIIFKQMAEQKNISVVLEDVERFIWTDPNHLLLVLRNILSNAIKYSYPNGQIVIRSKSKDQRVMIEVIDNGMGMSEKVKASIFQHDNIISNIGTANEKGTGLGLKLCKEFIEKNNGQIWVESAEQKGTVFYISLPEAK